MTIGPWKRWRAAARTMVVVTLSLLAAACAASDKKPGAAPSAPAGGRGGNTRYKVKAETTPFYKLGPQQPGGPDLQLKKDTRLTLVKRSFGFSQVRLDGDGGDTGIVGNEDIVPLTPPEFAAEQAPALAAANTARGGPAGAKPRRRSNPRLPGNVPLPPGSEPTLPGAEFPARTEPTPAFRY